MSSKEIVFDADPKLVKKLEKLSVLGLLDLVEDLAAEQLTAEMETTRGRYLLTVARQLPAKTHKFPCPDCPPPPPNRDVP